MHECVRRGKQVAHLVREAEQSDAALVRKVPRQAASQVVVVAAYANDGRIVDGQRGTDRPFEVPDSPAAARDHDHVALGRQPERLSR